MAESGSAGHEKSPNNSFLQGLERLSLKKDSPHSFTGWQAPLMGKAPHVRFRNVRKPIRYNEMSLCSISLYRAAGQARCYASVAKRHIAYQQVFKIPSASASTRPHGLRKPAARYRKDEAKAATSCRGLYEKGFGDLSAWL
jgi:hypothetical protein